MDLNWKKFSEKIPDCRLFWVSDFESVGLEIFSPLGIYQDYIEKGYVWAEAKIEYPPIPKKQRHRCQEISYDLALWCEERDEGLYLCCEHQYTNMLGKPASIYSHSKIVCCPFCGWSKEKK
jgi:hypothetical protein